MHYMYIPVCIVLVFLEDTLILGDGKEIIIFTFMFIQCILNNKCLLYTNICTNKWCKFILKLL